MPALGRLGQISCRDRSPLPPCYPQASSKQPARGREGTSEARSLGCSWDEPWDESLPLPPLLGHTVELCQTYFLVRCCYQKNLRKSEGRGRRKERGYHLRYAESQRGGSLELEPGPGPGSGNTQLSSELYPLPNRPVPRGCCPEL